MGSEDGILLPDLEGEASDLRYLLQDPQTEEELNKEMMSSYCTEDLSVIDDVDCSFGFLDEETGSRMSEFFNFKQQCMYSVFIDRTSQDVDEGVGLFADEDFSCCDPHFLLENCHAEYFAVNESLARKIEPQLWYQITEKDGGTGEISGLQNTKSPFGQSTWIMDNRGTVKFQDVHGSSLALSVPSKDEIFQNNYNSVGIDDFATSGDIDDPFQYCLSTSECEDELIWASHNVMDVSTRQENNSDGNRFAARRNDEDSSLSVQEVRKKHISSVAKSRHKLLNMEARESSLVAGRRLRKPCQRYVEETSEVKYRHSERFKTPSSVKSGTLWAIAPDKECLKETKSSQLFNLELDARSSAKRPRNLWQHRRCQGEATMCFDSEAVNKKNFLAGAKSAEIQSSKSQYPTENGQAATTAKNKSGIRPKNHRPWTLSEVMRLIEGVSHCGAGKWTKIKRIFFAKSAFRTSVDLKDKWRNLVRASVPKLPDDNQIGESTSTKIPQAVLRRIRELAVTQSYPSNRREKRTINCDSVDILYYQ